LVGWQVSPQKSYLLTTSPLQLLETGILNAQNLAAISTSSISGNYAESISGYSGSIGNFESTGNFLANGGSFSGDVDSQSDGTGLSLDDATDGTYAIDSTTGRGTGFIGNLPVSYYVADPTTVYVFSTSASSVYQGVLTSQP
jgi:hypothetical protein